MSTVTMKVTTDLKMHSHTETCILCTNLRRLSARPAYFATEICISCKRDLHYLRHKKFFLKSYSERVLSIAFFSYEKKGRWRGPFFPFKSNFWTSGNQVDFLYFSGLSDSHTRRPSYIISHIVHDHRLHRCIETCWKWIPENHLSQRPRQITGRPLLGTGVLLRRLWMSSQIATGRRGKRGQLGIGTPTTRESLTGFWTQRVAKIKWEWFVTLTFRRIDIPLWIAKRSFKDWIWEIENEVGRERFRWFRIIEYGSTPSFL